MITKFDIFDDIEKSPYDNIRLLKSYINRLEGSTLKLEKKYFIILHNFLILEIAFKDIIPSGRELNKYLCLNSYYNLEELLKLFNKLYSVDIVIRNNVEWLDHIDEIKEYIVDNPEILNKMFPVKKTLKDIELKRNMKKYNL